VESKPTQNNEQCVENIRNLHQPLAEMPGLRLRDMQLVLGKVRLVLGSVLSET